MLTLAVDADFPPPFSSRLPLLARNNGRLFDVVFAAAPIVWQTNEPSSRLIVAHRPWHTPAFFSLTFIPCRTRWTRVAREIIILSRNNVHGGLRRVDLLTVRWTSLRLETRLTTPPFLSFFLSFCWIRSRGRGKGLKSWKRGRRSSELESCCGFVDALTTIVNHSTSDD